MAVVDLLPALANFKYVFSDEKHSVLIVLKNNRGMHVAFTNYGARIVSLIVPDKHGLKKDVVLGFNDIKDYLSADECYHGATIGRYANRIKDGHFQLNGKNYQISPNNGQNALHGGKGGLHEKIWDRRIINPNEVTFSYISPDGEEGFPGNLQVTVRYLLTDQNEIKIYYRATSDQDTVINLTNHAYFNLNGEGQGDILDHWIQIQATHFLPINEKQIPEGISAVKGTPFDFNQAKKIKQDILEPDQQLRHGGNGYDHCYVLDPLHTNAKDVVATAYSAESGIRLEVLTTEPGVQFYTGNALTGKDIGKSGHPYKRQQAFCFETQHFPDAPNQDKFPSTLLKAKETYVSETIYRFNIIK